MRYGHIFAAVFGRPWAIRPDVLDIISEAVLFRVAGGRLTAEEIEARIEAAGPRSRAAAPATPGVAIIPLHGIIAPRAAMFEETSTGGTGLDTFMRAFRAAMADPDVSSIVLDIDSPGGQVDGVPEAAAEIRAARDRKPIVAVANYMAASAAYYLGSQAGQFVASPSAEVGSIGVRMAHEDVSGMMEQRGIKITQISAGRYKTEGSPYAPLGDEAIAYNQGQVDAYYAMFLDDVARGRRVTVEKVTADFGQGRMLMARDALRAGMVDRVAPIDEVVRTELERPVAAVSVTLAAPAVAHVEVAAFGRHQTPTSDAAWDGPANEARLPSPMSLSVARRAYAWYDEAAVEDDEVRKADCAFIHHEVGEEGVPGAANLAACSSGIAVLNGGRGGGPDARWWADREGIHAHLAGHLRDAGRDAPPLAAAADAARFAVELEIHRHRAAARR